MVTPAHHMDWLAAFGYPQHKTTRSSRIVGIGLQNLGMRRIQRLFKFPDGDMISLSLLFSVKRKSIPLPLDEAANISKVHEALSPPSEDRVEGGALGGAEAGSVMRVESSSTVVLLTKAVAWCESLSIGLPTMDDGCNLDSPGRIVNDIQNPVITGADSVGLLPMKLLHTDRPRILAQREQLPFKPLKQLALERIKLFLSGSLEENLITHTRTRRDRSAK